MKIRPKGPGERRARAHGVLIDQRGQEQPPIGRAHSRFYKVRKLGDCLEEVQAVAKIRSSRPSVQLNRDAAIECRGPVILELDDAFGEQPFALPLGGSLDSIPTTGRCP